MSLLILLRRSIHLTQSSQWVEKIITTTTLPRYCARLILGPRGVGIGTEASWRGSLAKIDAASASRSRVLEIMRPFILLDSPLPPANPAASTHRGGGCHRAAR